MKTKVRQPISFRVNEPYDWRGKAYYQLLHSTWSPCDRDRDTQDKHPTVPQYDPHFLDNPEYQYCLFTRVTLCGVDTDKVDTKM